MNVQAVAQVRSGRKRETEFVWPNYDMQTKQYCADNTTRQNSTANYQFQESEYMHSVIIVHVLFSGIHNTNTTIVSISCTSTAVADLEIRKGWSLKKNEPVGWVVWPCAAQNVCHPIYKNNFWGSVNFRSNPHLCTTIRLLCRFCNTIKKKYTEAASVRSSELYMQVLTL